MSSVYFLIRKLCVSIKLSILWVSVLLQSCATGGGQWNPNDYTVKSGDTVYSIAWRYELDPVEFAHWNNIDTDSYLIRPGQRLHVSKPKNIDLKHGTTHEVHSSKDQYQSVEKQSTRTKTSNKTTTPGWIRIRKGDTLYGISHKYNISARQLARLNQLKKPYLLKPGQTLFLKPLESKSSTRSSTKVVTKTQSKSTKGKTGTRAGSKPKEKWATHVRWQWPAKGKVIRHFIRNRHDAKGIDIAGSMGARVNAAADGKVVYSGDGLISYGNLIIIKHNKHYLSAYAYNHKLLVHEGQWVKAGQQIAEMGRKDKNSPRLHFEVRRNGKPVNPLRYLP